MTNTPTTITLKNIPEPIYTCLKQVAKAHHRSLNNEIIACLESILLPKKITANTIIKRIQELRKNMNAKVFNIDVIEQAIEEGHK